MLTIKIKRFREGVELPHKTNIGDWVDLRAAKDVTIAKGEFCMIPLGIGMKLPEGYEANIVPRSSFAVIDNSFCGDNDEWFYPVIALEDTVIHKNDRICQFRINEVQPDIKFEIVDRLDTEDRGGFGSTGTR